MSRLDLALWVILLVGNIQCYAIVIAMTLKRTRAYLGFHHRVVLLASFPYIRLKLWISKDIGDRVCRPMFAEFREVCASSAPSKYVPDV